MLQIASGAFAVSRLVGDASNAAFLHGWRNADDGEQKTEMKLER